MIDLIVGFAPNHQGIPSKVATYSADEVGSAHFLHGASYYTLVYSDFAYFCLRSKPFKTSLDYTLLKLFKSALVFTVTRLSGDVLFSIVVSIQGCNSF